MLSRMEHDSIGALNVPVEVYYGVQSMRAAEYSYAAEPPVQFRLSHLSRRSEPL